MNRARDDGNIGEARLIARSTPLAPARGEPPAAVPRMLERHATKIVCRNLVPLAMFDPDRAVLQRLARTFDPATADDVSARVDDLRWDAALAVSPGFEDRLRIIEDRCADALLSRRLEEMMHAAWASTSDAVVQPDTAPERL